jgi:drug/metabolite transporter (DMT)-like permease
VPVIAALAGVILFSEPITLRLAISSLLVLGGTALAVRRTLTFKTARVVSDR